MIKRTLLKASLLFITLLTIISCGKPSEKQSEYITGYIVRKEYKPEGRCHDGRQIQFEAGIIPLSYHHHHHVHRTRHHHHNESATYRIYVANHKDIVNKLTTKIEYDKYKCGQRVTILR